MSSRSPKRGSGPPPSRRPAGRPTAGRPPAGGGRTPQRVPARALRRPWWQQPWLVPAVVVVAAAVIAVAVLAGRSGGNGGGSTAGEGSPAPEGLIAKVTGVPAGTLAAVGDGGVEQPLHLVTGQPPLTGADGRPRLLYVGADYCPYCAVERWSLVVALSRFGTVGGLELTTSSSTDVFPDTHTFSFTKLSVTSDVLEVSSVELNDRNGNPLQTPTAAEASLLAAVDKPPLTNNPGAIPFISIGNMYATVGLPPGFQPQLLQGLTWDQIAQRLNDPADPVARAIVGNANRLTAGICAVTGGKPASVCDSPVIKQLMGQLPTS